MGSPTDVTLKRVFENLLLNACQGNGQAAARHIQVSMMESMDTEWIEVVVLDDGPGFAPELLSERQILSTKPDGTGIGLLTSDRLVSACGGTLQLANKQEGGARVTVRLLKEQAFT